MYDPRTPKGFYLNRGVYYFGRRIEKEMDQADNQARKNRKGDAANRMANAARLRVLEKHLGVPVKRYRDPGTLDGAFRNKIIDSESNKDKDEVVIIKVD